MARADWIVAGGILLLAGCGGFEDSPGDGGTDADANDDGGPPPADCDPARPNAVDAEVWAYIQGVGYADGWPHEPAWDGRHENLHGSPHGTALEIWVSPCVAATWGTGANHYPEGAMVLLHGHNIEGTLVTKFVMYRTTDEPGGEAWWWAAYEAASGTPIEAGQAIEVCDGCHSSGDDFVRAFTLDGA